MHEMEVFLILDNLDGKKSFGLDKLHPFLASVGAFQIFRPITYIIHLSIKQRTFPDNLKIAKVNPFFKQGSRSLCDNYLSNKPHFLWVYRRDNPRRMLGEHEKSL